MASCSSSTRRGSQTPSFHSCPPYGQTNGPLACDLARACGSAPDPWQAAVLDDWLARSDAGDLLCITAGLMVPRQNGKNEVILQRELFGLLVLGERVIHTAHEYSSAKAAFARMVELFGECPGDRDARLPWLNRRLRRVTRSAGQMVVELRNGARAEFRTRTDSGGRGQTCDLIVIDEAQELTDAQLEALSSANDSAPLGSPQTIYAGTPPEPGGRADVFGRMHRDVHDRGGPRTCWHEWGVDEIGDVTDTARWYATNPALGVRISEETVRAKLASMGREGFARERLGWWPDSVRRNPVSRQAWDACAAAEPEPGGDVSFAVKYSSDGQSVCVAAAARGDSGIHVELVEQMPAQGAEDVLAPLLAGVARRARAVVLDGVAGAPTLRERLAEEGFPARRLEEPNTSDLVEATSMFYSAVCSGGVTHFSQPRLTASVCGCVRVKTGRGWVFGGAAECDATPAEAAVLAYWAAATHGRKTRKGRVG